MNLPLNPRRFWALLAALTVLLLALSSLRALSVPDEGRYAEISRWMLQSGDWLVPRLNGLPFFHKPPLLHWLQSASMAVFGVSAWAARLVPAAAALGMLLALYGAARRLASEVVAQRAALMLACSLGFLLGGQYVNHDMLVACWIGVAIWCFALAFLHGDRPDASMARWGFAACALGLLTKGLIGVVLPGLVLFVWLLWTRQFRKVLQLPWLSGLAVFALIALPWFVLAQLRYPGLFDYLFGTQQFSRYTGKTFNNVQPWYFYLVALGGLLFPWVLWAPAATLRGSAPQDPGTDPRLVSLCWCWIGAIGLFFSVPHSKLVGYILPVVPPVALLASLGWQRLMARRRGSGAVFAGLALLTVGLAVVGNTLADRSSRHQLTDDVAALLACAMAPGDRVYAVGSAYPYDLSFLLQLKQPLVVVQDWPALRAKTGDNWRRELFEGEDFEPDLQQPPVLLTPDALATASQVAGHWLVAPNGTPPEAEAGWTQALAGRAWTLYRARPSAAEGPETAQQIGLARCGQKAGQQRQP